MFFWWRRTVLSKRVIVNLKTGTTFAGVLFDKRGPLVILKNPQLLEAGREATKLDGEVVFERSNVDFFQVAPTPTEG